MHHHLIAQLDAPGWLTSQADAFDPDRTSWLVVPDPLDPARAGTRRRLGRRQPAFRFLENKTVVDTLWDTLGVPRARSFISDLPHDVSVLGEWVDCGGGVVCSLQPVDGDPVTGGDGMWWWRPGEPPSVPRSLTGRHHVRLMPLLEGLPARLHGLVLPHGVVTFPPMEIVTLPRLDRGAFLCAGTVPNAALIDQVGLRESAARIGSALQERMGYRGGFSVDGIVTRDGFVPTDFNARLTSAMAAAPPELRVLLHTANLLAREGIGITTEAVETLAGDVFADRGAYTLHGAATRARRDGNRRIGFRWEGLRPVTDATSTTADGQLTLRPSPRGWLLTATLLADRLPVRGHLGPLAPAVFRLSDEVFGTDFGDLGSPFGLDLSGARPPWRPVIK
ncbi:hypothetical protein [Kitasatospora atroaurantiaca]|nr:hypothetical protein [Kitasatospora atroaurantiaca]